MTKNSARDLRRSFLVAAVLAVLAVLPAGAEVWDLTLGTTGWVKADLAILWIVDGVETADPGITVAEIGTSGAYTIDGMPDAVAGATTRYMLSVQDPLGRWFEWRYPARTRTPQAIAWEFSYGVVAGTNELSVDDTLPDLQLDVTGLSSNPTGSTVKFSMWCGGSTTATVDAATAAISNIELVGTTYSATLIYDWIAADTATAGSCLGRFHLTLAGGDTMTLPPRKQVPVTISR